MIVLVWVDSDSQYFITTIEYLEEDLSVLRHIWCQVYTDKNAYNHIVDLDIPKPLSANIYYGRCSATRKNNKQDAMTSGWRIIWGLVFGTSILI